MRRGVRRRSIGGASSPLRIPAARPPGDVASSPAASLSAEAPSRARPAGRLSSLCLSVPACVIARP